MYRSLNRRNWDYDKLIKRLKTPDSQNHKIYKELIRLIALRKKQPAFHPNATQFTLQLEESLFGVWRQSIDRSQSIFCISNLTKFRQRISLHDINLISTNKWYDIIKSKRIKNINDKIYLLPYQSMWISNRLV